MNIAFRMKNHRRVSFGVRYSDADEKGHRGVREVRKLRCGERISLLCVNNARVKRIPMVVSIAVDYSEFHSDVPSDWLRSDTLHPSPSRPSGRMETRRIGGGVGKSGRLAFQGGGLDRRTDIFHDMPDFYREVALSW